MVVDPKPGDLPGQVGSGNTEWTEPTGRAFGGRRTNGGIAGSLEIALGLASSDDYWSRALFGRGPSRVTEFRQTPNAN